MVKAKETELDIQKATLEAVIDEEREAAAARAMENIKIDYEEAKEAYKKSASKQSGNVV